MSPTFGLGVGIQCMGLWLHGGDPLRPLRYAELASELSKALDAEPLAYWQRLLTKHFVDNSHRVTLVAAPDAEYDAKLQRAEEEEMAAAKAALSPADVERCVAAASELREAQDSPQDVDSLPRLAVATAVDRQGVVWPSEFGTLGARGHALQLDAQPTNGVCYASAAFDLAPLPARLAPYLPYFVSLLTELGTTSRDFERLAHDIKATTAGVGAGYGYNTDVAAAGMGGGGMGGGGGGVLGLTEATLTLSGGCLERNAAHLGDIMAELCAPGSVRWRGAEGRIEELLRRRAAALGGSLGSGGGRYAARRAAGALTAAGALSDELGGLHHVAHARRLAMALSEGGSARDAALDEVATACEEISTRVLHGGGLRRVRACAPRADLDGALLPQLTAWADGLPPPPHPLGEMAADEPKLLDVWRYGPSVGVGVGAGAGAGAGTGTAAAALARREFIGVPSQSNYVYRCVRTVPYAHDDAPPLLLLAQVALTRPPVQCSAA